MLHQLDAGDLLSEDGQIEWRGLLLGAGTPYRLRSLQGWSDLPEVRDSDVELATGHGYQPGRLLLGRRTITFEFLLSGSLGEFRRSVAELQRVTAPRENDTEEPLVIRMDGETMMVRARCIGRSLPTEKQYALGRVTGTIRWRATNPRKLHIPAQTHKTSAPRPGTGGLLWPLEWPLVWGSAQSGGEIVAYNEGNADAQPVWRITGPCLGPVIQNADTGRSLVIDSEYLIPAGQRLTLTTADRTVLLDGGVSRNNRLVKRGWFTLPPGMTRVRFDSEDKQGRLELLYYSTSL